MLNRLKNSLLLRIALAMTIIITLSFLGIFSSVFIAETTEGYAAAINQAGTLRMQSYRIASSLAHPEDTDTPYSVSSTQQLVDEFEQRLLSDRIHHVVSKEDIQTVQQAYKSVEEQWFKTIRPGLEKYLISLNNHSPQQTANDAIGVLRKAYLSNVDSFVEDIHHFVKVLEIEAEEKIQQLRIIQIIALVLTLLVVMIVMQLMHKDVILPLGDLMASARAVRKGDFSLRAKTSGEDELDQLGVAFNTMSENLSTMYEELEDRVKQKTADLEQTNRSLELLYMTTQRLGESPVTPEVLTAVIHDIENLIGIHSGTVCLGKPGDNEAYRMASTAKNEDWNRSDGFKNDCQRCLGNGTPHVFKISVTEQDHTIVSIPIKSQDKQYGVLLLELNQYTALENWQQRLLETVASHIAIALERAQHVAQSRMISLSEERSVIARELHDSIAQSLSYLKIQVSRLENSINNDAEKSQTLAISSEIRDGLNEAYRQLRELLTTFRLRINEAGLAEALEETVRGFTDRGGIDIELINRTANCQFNPNAEIHLIHIIREALSNIFQHSQATRAKVLLQCNLEGKATLLIADNGVGINNNHSEIHHYGLSIMKERAKGLGGLIEFNPLPDGGTSIRLTFSISS